MKGLLIKDFYLITQNKKTFLIYLFCCAFMALSVDVSFVAGYIAMLFGIITMSTLSYDEYDRGMTFLMTLPVDGRTYVREKFFLLAINEMIGFVTGFIFMAISFAFKGQLNTLGENVISLFVFTCATGALMTMMIPIELKYGVEKGRIVMMVFYGVFGVSIAALSRLLAKPENFALSLIEKLNSIPEWVVIVFAVLLLICIVMTTYLFSLRVMEKKEY